jgi:hypothetical protein
VVLLCGAVAVYDYAAVLCDAARTLCATVNMLRDAVRGTYVGGNVLAHRGGDVFDREDGRHAVQEGFVRGQRHELGQDVRLGPGDT